ncbi:hypothetical protein WAF17_19600 [Bernardetia sp. ABR2-2B]|uniref:hypothetical protein n=1 Tax=Bernardetia sp. ABR2-2B TaxID=3127472 RepID=UPI0030D53699
MKFVLFVLLSLAFMACNPKNKTTNSVKSESQENDFLFAVKMENEDKEPKKNLSDREQKYNEPQKKEVNKILENDSVFIVKFEKLDIKFISSDIDNKGEDFEKIYTDSIKINLGLGENFKNKTFEIIQKHSSIANVEVFESYQTSMGVSDEGAHLDLLNWKHFNSEWQKLIINKNSFVSKEYSRKESELFPKVTTKQILEAVRIEYGSEKNKFTERAKNCKDANDYPCSVMINQFNFKIVVTDKNGSKTNYFILINLPMGC